MDLMTTMCFNGGSVSSGRKRKSVSLGMHGYNIDGVERMMNCMRHRIESNLSKNSCKRSWGDCSMKVSRLSVHIDPLDPSLVIKDGYQ